MKNCSSSFHKNSILNKYILFMLRISCFFLKKKESKISPFLTELLVWCKCVFKMVMNGLFVFLGKRKIDFFSLFSLVIGKFTKNQKQINKHTNGFILILFLYFGYWILERERGKSKISISLKIWVLIVWVIKSLKLKETNFIFINEILFMI